MRASALIPVVLAGLALASPKDHPDEQANWEIHGHEEGDCTKAFSNPVYSDHKGWGCTEFNSQMVPAKFSGFGTFSLLLYKEEGCKDEKPVHYDEKNCISKPGKDFRAFKVS